MIITADTTQLKLVAADLARAGVTVQQPVSREMRESAKEVRRGGRENVRKLTGTTARSITFSSKKKGLRFEIGPTWFVGRFLEFGTVNMPAYPFMEPAARGQVDRLPDRVAKAAADATLTGGQFSLASLI